MTELSAELTAKRDALMTLLQGLGSCAVAMSAGVDSSLVAQAAYLALGSHAIAVTASSASLATGELQQATDLARQIGIAHRTLETDEFATLEYRRNAPDRCYHCKTELYSQLERLLPELGVSTIVNGANLDDQGDYRPGMIAAGEHRVRSPLLECGFTKADVRALAAHWNLPVWDKPASPCLSSRIAYGEEVTSERVAMIDQAEQYLHGLGLREIRVRYHRGDLARVEVAIDDLSRLTQEPARSELIRTFRALGFKFVTLDLAGFRSGSLNDLLPLAIQRPS